MWQADVSYWACLLVFSVAALPKGFRAEDFASFTLLKLRSTNFENQSSPPISYGFNLFNRPLHKKPIWLLLGRWNTEYTGSEIERSFVLIVSNYNAHFNRAAKWTPIAPCAVMSSFFSITARPG